MTVEELKALLDSGQPEKIDRAVEHLIGLLTSEDGPMRERGYAMLQEGLNEALYQSCLNYRALLSGATSPLLAVVMQTVEFWAVRRASESQ
ncbi:MAG: hypothetical protein ACREE2_01930 [Stellaceae bacterium]